MKTAIVLVFMAIWIASGATFAFFHECKCVEQAIKEVSDEYN